MSGEGLCGDSGNGYTVPDFPAVCSGSCFTKRVLEVGTKAAAPVFKKRGR